MKNYEKLEFIYGNGHDKVYACVSKKDRRKYAMKFINIPTKEFQKQNREVELYQKLHHENLIYMEECFSHQQ
jgi:serine/threonine protein kinase